MKQKSPTHIGAKNNLVESTYIPTQGDGAFIGAAMYLATIAYPNNLENRTDFVNACRAWMFAQNMKGRLKKTVISNPDILAFSKTRRINAQFNKAIKHLRKKRAIALRICKMMMVKDIMNELHPIVKPVSGVI